MLTLCWNERGRVLEQSTPRETVISAMYADLSRTIYVLLPGPNDVASAGVLLQHDNTQHLSACATLAII